MARQLYVVVHDQFPKSGTEWSRFSGDGSYEQYCDLSRQYDPAPSPKAFPNGTVIPAWNGTSADKWLLEFGRVDLLDYRASII